MAKLKSVTHLSTNSYNSGSGIAAIRLHNAINENKEFESFFFTEYIKNYQFNKRIIYEHKLRTLHRKIFCKLFKIVISKNSFLNKNFESYSFLPIAPRINLNQKLCSEIFNIHWVQHEFINIFDFFRLPKNRIVWTLHDCWPIDGTEHYPLQSKKPKYYKKIQSFIKQTKKDLIKNKNIQLVAPSNWIKEKALKSFGDFIPKVITIPNPIPDIFFEEYEKSRARKNLNLPKDKILILFSSFGGEGDLRKGINLIRQLLNHEKNKKSNLEFITIGSFKNLQKFNKEKLINLGKINGNNKLREVYKASDIVLVPSLIDNLPQVATEAQACGRPVIGFNTGGMQDIIINNETGYLSNDQNLESIQDNINKLIRNKFLSDIKSNQITERAIKLWSNNIISNSYTDLYNYLLTKK